MLDGRVSASSEDPRRNLARRDVPEHLAALAKRITPIDLVVVALYPSEQTVARRDAGEAIEQIDVGGPMIRAAAKNQGSRSTAQSQYAAVLDELRQRRIASDATLPPRARRSAAPRSTTRPSRPICPSAPVPGRVSAAGCSRRSSGSRPSVLPLRQGENPHQEAAFYRQVARRPWASPP
jgi:phosphoribosylaminoimidazolecarboxamide formyltransferase/IMP cyclohydrolase